MNCVVVDDESLSRKVLEKCIADTPFLNLVGSYSRATQLQKELSNKSVDLIFLDIQMPEMSGLEFVKSLKDIPQVVFVTSRTNYAVEAFENNVTDYLVKPINFQRFLKSAEKAKKINDLFSENQDDNIIYVKSDSRLIKVDLSHIVFIEALGDYVRLHTKSAKYTILSTMKAMETKLKSSDFQRVHKSYIVRIDKILKVEKNVIHMENVHIPVSRTYKDVLKSSLNIL
ncbi:MAG: DNA-binding response regulator [Crocinitomicaceae bacterium]|nr:DNA-binding response regulator [Crocinitomicaceae bacterium]|tara:strand:+ start:18133 stop:18816 length:684 start_codon:yes stop_codon:yes gene_type:complete